MGVRHFLTVGDLTPAELGQLLGLASELKAERKPRQDLAGLSIGMIFEKPSTRTRVSFEVGIAELGAQPVVLSAAELQLGRGETVEDTGRVLSRYLHALVVRTFGQERLSALAAGGSVPIINALSDSAHPCQALADLLTIQERLGGLEGVTLAYLGDGNNVANSLIEAGGMAGMRVTIGCPAGYEPDQPGAALVTDDPVEAVRGADVVYTDVWASMGQEAEHEQRVSVFEPYQLDGRLLAEARPGAIVLHCLPAHRGEEIAAEVIDGPQSAVWDQAENRLHSQKALLLVLLGER